MKVMSQARRTGAVIDRRVTDVAPPPAGALAPPPTVRAGRSRHSRKAEPRQQSGGVAEVGGAYSHVRPHAEPEHSA